MKKVKGKKSLVGYLSRREFEEVGTVGSKLCNAFCMPALCIKPYGDAKIKVRYTFEELP
jgi:hypothetical protein